MEHAQRTRVATGLASLAVVFLAILYLPAQALSALLALVMLVVAWEWLRMLCRSYWTVALHLAAVAVLMLALLGAPQAIAHNWILYASVIWWSAIFILIAVWNPRLAEQPALFWFLRLGVLLAVPTAWLALLKWQNIGLFYLLYLVSLVAIADTAAFYCGRMFGRQKMAPSLSPNKTYAGFWGAMAAVLLFAALLSYLRELPWLLASSFILASLIAGLLSVVGDLGESMVKRCARRKNSGRLLPGHGGLFDRLDSLLAAAPAFFLSYSPLAAP